MMDMPCFAWQREANKLAQWAEERLVNRTDVYGRYLPMRLREPGKSNNYTAPNEEDRRDGALDMYKLVQHFRGADHSQLIGLHAISRQNTCKWFLIDIDQHGEDATAQSMVNRAAAVGWYEELKRPGFHPLLLDSNGAGGFHLLVMFSVPIPSTRVFAFAHQFVENYAARGLIQAPEVFPKQPEVNGQRRYGNWARLPGRHHTRNHWTKVWDGVRWLEGQAAIEAILEASGDSPDLIPVEVKITTVTANQGRPGRVGVGPRRPTYESPYDVEHWLGILEGREPGGRHPALLELAGHLLGKRVDPVVVEELCVIWNEARNQPPHGEQHIRQTVQDLVKRSSASMPGIGSYQANQTTTYRLN